MRYTHHGIDLGDGTVVHYAGKPVEGLRGKAAASFVREPFEAFCWDDAPVWRLDPVAPLRRLTPALTIGLAISMIGTGAGEYRLLSSNCEHFATGCQLGLPISFQVKSKSAAVRQSLLFGNIGHVVPLLPFRLLSVAVTSLPLAGSVRAAPDSGDFLTRIELSARMPPDGLCWLAAIWPVPGGGFLSYMPLWAPPRADADAGRGPGYVAVRSVVERAKLDRPWGTGVPWSSSTRWEERCPREVKDDAPLTLWTDLAGRCILREEQGAWHGLTMEVHPVNILFHRFFSAQQ